MNRCLWKGSRTECESWPYCRRCTWQKTKKQNWERERGQNCKLPDVWGMISHVRASFSKDWMGNAAKSVTQSASRQNSLLMPWLIVAYALCTMLADHPNTQSIVQTTHLCLRCEAKVKVVAPWQTAYSLLMGTLNSVIQPMQKVQNTAAHLLLRAPRHQNCTPLLQQLHWLPFSERIKYKTACLCYNAIRFGSVVLLNVLGCRLTY